ncbi:MAG: methyltransferase domain-containing protein [Myxococcales bacterium]|nr:methyltransferase domain-containing protein [Myxococcales bacterium]
MSSFDREKWEARYRDGRGYGGAPDPFLDEVAARFLPRTGRALDLAGGTGRHARWLAQRGLEVTLCDISPSALQTAASWAQEEGLALHTSELDLDEAFPEGPWDVVLVSFFLVRDLLPALVAQLSRGGVFVLVHPTRRNLERHAKPTERWLLEDGELDEGVPGLLTLHHEEGFREGGRHEVRYVGRRVSSSGAEPPGS